MREREKEKLLEEKTWHAELNETTKKRQNTTQIHYEIHVKIKEENVTQKHWNPVALTLLDEWMRDNREYLIIAI